MAQLPLQIVMVKFYLRGRLLFLSLFPFSFRILISFVTSSFDENLDDKKFPALSRTLFSIRDYLDSAALLMVSVLSVFFPGSPELLQGTQLL